MFNQQKMTDYYKNNKNEIGGKFNLNEWLEFCREWDAACRKLRAAAGKEVQNE